jgi:quercetin dioxygenase-like cupin family protein
MLKKALLIVLSAAGLGMMSSVQGVVTAADPPPATLRLTSTFPYTGAPAQYEVVNQVLEFANGAATREHRHGGPGFVTVLEGQSTRRVGDEVNVYTPRQSYLEPQGTLHSVRATGRTRVYASFLLSPGVTQTINDPTYVAPEALNTTPILSKTTLNTQPGEFTVTQLVFDFAPGAVLPLHKHGGQGLATVFEGELTFSSPAGEVKRAANTSFSNITSAHEVRNAGSTNATLLVVVLLPKDAEPTTYLTIGI